MRRIDERLDQLDQRFGVEDDHFNQMGARLNQMEGMLKTQQEQIDRIAHETQVRLGRLMMMLALVVALGLVLLAVVLLRP